MFIKTQKLISHIENIRGCLEVYLRGSCRDINKPKQFGMGLAHMQVLGLTRARVFRFLCDL
jgi:hypothetical protein